MVMRGEGGIAPAINDKPVPGVLLKTQVCVGLGKKELRGSKPDERVSH